PRAEDVRTTSDVIRGTAPAAESSGTTDPHTSALESAANLGFASTLENRYFLNLVMGGLGLSALWSLYAESGFRISLNILHFAFLFLGLLLHPSPASFTRAVSQGLTYLQRIAGELL